MNESVLSSLGFKLMLLLTAGVSVGVMGVAASKATSAMSQTKIPSSGLEIGVKQVAESPTTSPTSTPVVAQVDLKEIEVPIQVKTKGKCIITLFEKKYDVTEPNMAAKGGDIFRCGGDMTNLYNAKYGTNVEKMQRFLVGGTSTVTPLPTTTTTENLVTPTGIIVKPTNSTTPAVKTFKFDDDDNEREDRENKKMYENSDDDGEDKHEDEDREDTEDDKNSD